MPTRRRGFSRRERPTKDQVLNMAKAEFSGDPAIFSIVTEGVRETVFAAIKGRIKG